MNKTIDLSAFEQAYDAINQFEKEHGISRKIIEPGHIETNFNIEKKHLSSPGVAHGGSMSALIDSTLGYAALTAAIVDGNLVSTVEFKMNYLKPILLGDELLGKGKVIRKGKTLIISQAEIYRGEELVTIAQGTFNVYPMDKREFI